MTVDFYRLTVWATGAGTSASSSITTVVGASVELEFNELALML